MSMFGETTMENLLKLQRLSERSTPEWVEAARTQMSYDIVSSAWKHAAVHKRTGKELTSFVEDNVIYGAGIKTVKNTLKIDAGIDMSFQEVKARVTAWFDFYEYFREWHDMHKAQLNIYGYVDIETALGRKVRTYKLTDSLNFPIQGSAVEVTKMSLGLLCNSYEDVHVINTIHDANILCQNIEDADLWKERLSKCMVDAWKYVIQDLANPNVPMPEGSLSGPLWTFH